MYDNATTSDLIRLAQIEAGMTVIDIYPSAGDWTRLFSDVVGPQGRVFGFVPAEVAHFKSDPVGIIRALSEEEGRGNVVAASADLVALAEVTEPADAVWLHLFYHDLHTELMRSRGGTAAAFNRSVYKALKPGGSFTVIDHAAAAGAGNGVAQSFHRIEPDVVRAEVEGAGFVFQDQSDLLANPDDPQTISAFDPSVKGKTDRFVYRFEKR